MIQEDLNFVYSSLLGYKFYVMNAIKNQVQLIGNLGKDVQLLSLDGGRKLAKFTLATNSFYKNKEGEKVQETQWHNCTVWGKKAETMEQMLRKGSEVIVHGKLTYTNYVDKEGIKRYNSEIVVQDFMTLSKKDESPL